MKLYSGPLSLFTAKVRVALAEKGLAYERIDVGWSFADRYRPHHPDVVAKNPKAEVPVLVDGELTLYDSTLICEYLEDAHPDPALFPADPAGRARCRQLEAAADEILFPHVWAFIEEVLYPAGDGGRDAARLERARAGLRRHHADLDARLADRDWLCGDFSVADIANFIFLAAVATMGGTPDAEHTHLQGWFGRMAARPTLEKEMAGLQAFLAEARHGQGG